MDSVAHIVAFIYWKIGVRKPGAVAFFKIQASKIFKNYYFLLIYSKGPLVIG